MKFILRYIREHLGILLAQLLFSGIFAAAFYLYRLPLAAVLYPAGICMLLGSILAAGPVYKAYRKHKKLSGLKSLGGDVLAGALLEYREITDEDYRQIILKLQGEMQSREERMQDSYREMTDYFTVWVHQIKTPIASMHLCLEAEDTKLARRLTSDLLHIEQYVEMVLTYFRLGMETTDYVFRTVSLDKVVKENIRRLRGDFIIKKLNLQYTPLEETAVSDEKWLSFVVEQVLSNALKYTGEGTVSIFLEEPKTLCISDTGIGIAPEDIPRIFERGYTGNNGRMDKRASGIGLYLCKQICGRLGIGISVSSEVDAGTTVRLDLSRKDEAVEAPPVQAFSRQHL